jgi:hypothetical protein
LTWRLATRASLFALAITVVSPIAVILDSAEAGASYNGSAAASWADRYWNTYNPNYMYYNTDDCTNFVTQSMVAGGGFPPTRGIYTNLSNFFNDPLAIWQNWPADNGPTSWTATLALDLFTYLNNSPKSVYEGNYSYADNKLPAPSFNPNTVVTGDVLQYDFGSGAVSHTSMQVGYGTDSFNYYGNWVDTHNNDHYHEFWTLKPTNAAWQRTRIYYFHIVG